MLDPTPKPRGRPLMDPMERRDVSFRLALTPTEYVELANRAAFLDLTISDYLRSIIWPGRAHLYDRRPRRKQ